MKTVLLCVLTYAVSATLSGDTPEARKQPWQWNTEERIEARLDPVAAHNRVTAMLARRGDRRGQVSAQSQPSLDRQRPTDYIEGRAHPQLFFPHEILTIFLRSAYGANDEVGLGFRETAAAAAIKVGLPDHFFAAFEREGAGLIELQAKEAALRNALSEGTANAAMINAQLIDLESEQCPAKAALLKKLRESYGDAVDRFLYLGLAPEMSRVIIGPLKSARELRQADRGCR